MTDGVQSREGQSGNTHLDMKRLTEIPIDEPADDIASPCECREVSAHAQQHEEKRWVQRASRRFRQYHTPAKSSSGDRIADIDHHLP